MNEWRWSENGQLPNTDTEVRQVLNKLHTGKMDLIKTVLKGADLNARNGDGNTVMHDSFLLPNWTEPQALQLAHLLLELGFNANAEGHQDVCLLWHCVRADFCELATLLLAYGADANCACTNNHFNGPHLHEAILRGHVRIFRLLLWHGANPKLQNSRGQTPFAALRVAWKSN